MIFLRSFSLEEYIAQPRYAWRVLVLPQSDIPDFDDSLWEVLLSLKIDGGGVGGK